MARQCDILKRLLKGPATNAELQEACTDHGGGIARTISQMREFVQRVDGGSGRGSKAIYALKGWM